MFPNIFDNHNWDERNYKNNISTITKKYIFLLGDWELQHQRIDGNKPQMFIFPVSNSSWERRGNKFKYGAIDILEIILITTNKDTNHRRTEQAVERIILEISTWNR